MEYILFVLSLMVASSSSSSSLDETIGGGDVLTTTSAAFRASSIVGGFAVDSNNKSPYPAYAISQGKWLCGATLIYPDILLTAAHCQVAFVVAADDDSNNNANTKNKTVCIGASHQRDCRNTGSDVASAAAVELRTVTDYLIHPKFNAPNNNIRGDNDIMLLRLDLPSLQDTLDYNSDPNSSLLDNQAVTTIGFGKDETGTFSNVLLEVNLTVVPNDKCYKETTDGATTTFNVDEATQICAHADSAGSCQGDSGSPLLLKNTGDGSSSSSTVVGIVSFSDGDCGAVPVVYTRVSAFANFIRNGICQLSARPPKTCFN